MPPDEFVAHLTTIMVGAINGTCELLGIKIDPAQRLGVVGADPGDGFCGAVALISGAAIARRLAPRPTKNSVNNLALNQAA